MNLTQVTLETTAYVPSQLVLEGPTQIAFSGRSNVGKSSLLNKLFNRRNFAKVSQTPGKTQSINYFLVNKKIYFVDLPGYGYAKAGKVTREKWQRLLEMYFEKNTALAGLAHLIDIRHEPTELDIMLHEWTQNLVKNHLYILTKADKVANNRRIQAANELAKELGVAREQVVVFSTEMGDGKQRVLEWVSSLTR